MLIGEGPGVEEDKSGRPFVGKAGRELWRYLWQSCQRTRESTFTTNLVKYRVSGDGDPSEEDIARDKAILDGEIANVNPDTIVCLGRWSTRRFLGDVDMEICHGIPRFVGHRCIFPVIHPAAGLHSTEFQGTIAWDFEQLGKLLRGEDVEWATTDEYPNPKYDTCGHTEYHGMIAVDTEGSARRPWCMSWCAKSGEAYAVKNQEAIKDPVSKPVGKSGGSRGIEKAEGPPVQGLWRNIPLLRDGVRPREGQEVARRGTHEASHSGANPSRSREVRLSMLQLPQDKNLQKNEEAWSNTKLILHNSMFDLGVLRSMGITGYQFDDTMLMSYLLCVEPQGLKALAKRHCGMEMSSYQEVLGDAQLRHNREWLSRVLNNAFGESTATSSKPALGKNRPTSASDGKKSRKTSRTKRRG